MKITIRYPLYCACLLFSVITSGAESAKSAEKATPDRPNILFIAIDDLRAELGVYGNKVIQTPNLDKLAASGTAFNNHFVQVPTCGASRHSLLTGMRPSSQGHLKNGVTENLTSNKPETELPESFIHHLKRNGYYTVGIGKISHSPDGLLYKPKQKPSNKRELPYSWDELLFDSGKWQTGWSAFFGYANGENRHSLKKQVKPYEAGKVADDGYPDGLTTKLAVAKLKELKGRSKPFFLGVGYFKPHLPFNAPEKYWNLYKAEDIPISANPDIPQNIHKSSLHGSAEFNQYALGDEKAGLKQGVSDAYARKLTHAYYASVSYIDQQVGVLVNEIHQLGLAQNTIIIVWGDHGWHLGDQRVWGKHTIFENALNSAFIIKVPGIAGSKEVNQSIIETVDIYPTLLELTNIEAASPLDGDSFVELITHPKVKQENVAYSYFRKGISLRTNRYRLTKYFRAQQPTIELYDHLNDPLESNNIAKQAPDIVNELMPVLEKGNTGLYGKQK